MLLSIIAKALNVSERDLNELVYMTPEQRKVRARKLLGLTSKDLHTIAEIKRISPQGWALKELDITPMKYRKLLSDKDNSQEFEDVVEQEKAKALAKIEKFGSLRSMLRGAAGYWYASNYKQQEWRNIEPIHHMQFIQSIVNNIVDEQRIEVHSAFDIIIHLYYTLYNSVYGTIPAPE